MKIFPDLKSGLWGYLNLNEESKETDIDFTNPKTFQRWLKEIHKSKGLEYSFGGFLENRENIWANHYNKKEKLFIHLGIDYNVPVKTKVAVPLECVVTNIFYDKDNHGGWGKRILFQSLNSKLPIYFIYGHLKQEESLKANQKIKPYQIIGEIGNSDENGGWYPHLHVQVMTKKFIGLYSADLTRIDGYTTKSSKLIEEVLNPSTIIS